MDNNREKTWNPEIGDKIDGKLKEIKQNVGKYKQSLYILEKNNKKTEIWGKTHLNQLMDEIKVNDYIRITYNGEQPTKNGRKMKKYCLERRIKE